MADRILVWYLPEVMGDGTNQGATFCLEQGYALPAKVRIYAVRAPEGGDLVIDIKDDGESIFGTHEIYAVEPFNIYSIVNYQYGTLATSTFSVGENIAGGTSSALAEIMAIDNARLDVRMIKSTPFAAEEEITGQTNSATADVDAFVAGKTTPRFAVTNPTFYAILPSGTNFEEHAENFAPDKTAMRQYSLVTLDVVKSGGAKQITVQLELDHEYKEEKPDEED